MTDYIEYQSPSAWQVEIAEFNEGLKRFPKRDCSDDVENFGYDSISDFMQLLSDMDRTNTAIHYSLTLDKHVFTFQTYDIQFLSKCLGYNSIQHLLSIAKALGVYRCVVLNGGLRTYHTLMLHFDRKYE